MIYHDGPALKIPVDGPAQADRHNVGKLRWALVYWPALNELVKVLEEGAMKYAPDNWKKGLNREEILESIQRHLVALFDGEEYDPDFKGRTHHIGHIMCNCMFYLYHYWRNSFSKERNNPFKK